MTPATSKTAGPSLAARLGNARVSLREDLVASRHLFRGEPSYIVRDPMTGQHQRLNLEDYAIFTALCADRTLSVIFKDLCDRKLVQADHEDRFYQFVMALHGLGFLRLPLSDHAALYRRHLHKARARRIQAWTSFLFLRIPLWCPDSFLERSLHWVRPLFTRGFFTIWVNLMFVAGYMAYRHFEQLREPLEGVLVAGNVPLLWITLVVLKAFHELGHAYACKRFGGHVPEMGAYLVLFTPCAYVDATASWSFPRKRDRIVVCLAGMYVESLFAAAALFVWALTPPSALHSAAYNVLILAGVVTVFFNINPLMRYDGYYVLSDLIEVPNLRERASRQLSQLAKRVLLGLRNPLPPLARGLKGFLVAYGVGAAIYRVILILGIAALLASKLWLAGLALALAYLLATGYGVIRSLRRYLWHSLETEAVRGRAIVLGVFVLVLVPAALLCFPLPRGVWATGALTRAEEHVVRAGVPGFLSGTRVEAGQCVARGDVLAELTEDIVGEELLNAECTLEAGQIRLDALRTADPVEAMKEIARVEALRLAVMKERFEAEALRIVSPVTGCVMDSVTDRDLGKFLSEGTSIALVVSGAWHLKSYLTEDQWNRVAPRLKDRVEFRPSSRPERVYTGTLLRTAPVTSRNIEWTSLTEAAGGNIVTSIGSGETIEPRIEITIELEAGDSPDFIYGLTGSVHLPARAEPLGRTLIRRFQAYLARLSMSD